MGLAEYYGAIRSVHIYAVIASGGLFFLRGVALFAGLPYGMSLPIRILAISIDTVLLTAALMLMTIVQQYPFANGWLTAKVLLVVVYIGLGFFAFWKSPTQRARLLVWAGALVIFAVIVSIARTRHPLGWFAG